MSTVLSVKALFEPVRSLAFGSIGAAYMGVGLPLNNPIRNFFIQNLTDVPVMFSFNGVDDNFPLPANGFFVLDITTNKSQDVGLYIAEGSRLYVKQLSGAPSKGAVYFSVIYGA